jgi:hypothetical protein
MSELFQTTPENITIHLKNIFSEGELDPDSVTKESLVTARDGKSIGQILSKKLPGD